MSSKENRKKTTPRTGSFENLEPLAVPVIVINSGLEVLFANSALCKLFGYASKHLLKKNISLVLPGFNSNSLRNLKQKKKLEFNGRSRDNKTLYLELSFGILKEGRNNLYIISIES